MKTRFLPLPCLLLLGTLAAAGQGQAPPNGVWLETLDLSKMTQDYGKPQSGKSIDNHPLTLGGKVYPHGVGTHSRSDFLIDLHGAAKRFEATVGADDETKNTASSVTFQVLVDGKTAYQSGVQHGGDAPKAVSVDLTGARYLRLQVGDAGNGEANDHADWAGAIITMQENAQAKPEAITPPPDPPRMTMPALDPAPAIHGPRRVGATPGKPFLFRVPATGQEPLTYTATGLPQGLTFDKATGIITGTLSAADTKAVTITVRGPKGRTTRQMEIVGGKGKLALTPPMGWNSWNAWLGDVDADKVRAAADGLVSTGLAAHGYQYVNIDDTWEAGRNAAGVIQTNDKFPEMKTLADDLHAKGLKLGIYSSPGATTCANFPGSLGHEKQDAQTYAGWGIDYLKYDWCGYEDVAKGDHSLPVLQKPYTLMGGLLETGSRDIVYSLCQYGMGDVWRWGSSTGGNLWRTTGDIVDSWDSMHGIASAQNMHEIYARPGAWNDPDMLVVGTVAFGGAHPTKLTPNEQITHISLWCLLSAPLLIGTRLDTLDPFTLALLTNDEALDIDQDPLGRPAGRVAVTPEGGELWARPLFDGTRAVGLVNSSRDPQTLTVHWSEIGLSGPQSVRDLWLHKDLGMVREAYSVEVPAHGCVLLKVGTPTQSAQISLPEPGVVVPGEIWRDTTGTPIQAHGAGMLQVGSTVYWFGEDKTNGYPFQNVNCYSSEDLVHWTFRSHALPLQGTGDLGSNRVVERPKVIYNRRTKTYVMYLHIDPSNYAEAKVGVATAARPEGPYSYQGSFRPLGYQSRDMTLYVDDDDAGYLVFEDRASGVRIVRLSPDYLHAEKEVTLIPHSYEAPAVVKVKGTYYLLGSFLSGWDPNPNQYATAPSLAGPWSDFQDVAPPATKTYQSQTAFILPVVGSKTTSYIYVGDRWERDNLKDSRYVWLPLEIGDKTMALSPERPWTIDVKTGEVQLVMPWGSQPFPATKRTP